MENSFFKDMGHSFSPMDYPSNTRDKSENKDIYQVRPGGLSLAGIPSESSLGFNISEFQSFETQRSQTMYSLQSQVSSRNISGFYNSKKFSTSLFSSDDILTEIVKIIKENDIDSLANILSNNINRLDNSGLSPLKIAIILSNMTSVSLILNHPQFDESKFQDLLNFSCEISTNDLIDELLNSKRFDVNYKDECGNTPLLISVNSNKLNTFKRLLDEPNIDVNCKDSLGNVPIIKCFYDKKTEMIDVLLSRADTDLNVKDKMNVDILKIAIKLSYNEMILKILNNSKFDLSSLTDLQDYFIDCITHISIDKAVTDKLSLLVDINYQDCYNNTALLYTIFNSNVDKMESILRNPNVDLGLINVSGMNCLMVACAKSGYDCLSRLLNRAKKSENFKEILNQVNKNGENCLFLAVKNNHEAIVRLLLEYNVDVNLKDSTGTTPLIWSIVNQKYTIAKLLLNYSTIDINQTDFNDTTALMYCLNGNVQNFNRISGVSCNTFDMKMDTIINLIFQILKNEDLDINRRNSEGRTVFMELLLKAFGITTNNETCSKSLDPFCSPLMGNFPDCYGYSMNGSGGDFSDILSGNNSDSYYNIMIGEFLKRDDIELDLYDNSGKNILIYLIENGNMELFNQFFKYLESGRIDANSTNNEGQNCIIQTFFNYAGKPVTDNNEGSPLKVVESNNSLGMHTPITANSYMGTITTNSYTGITNNYTGTSVSSISSKKSTSSYLYFLRRLLKLESLDLNKADIWGNSFIHYICNAKNLASLRLVVEEKANIDLNKTDARGYTPVMLCYINKFWDGVKLLGNLDAVDLSLKNSNNCTLFDLGREQPSVLKNLLKKERFDESVQVSNKEEINIPINFNQSYDQSKVKYVEKKGGWFS